MGKHLRDPENYTCHHCGNHVPFMTWLDIKQMLQTYVAIRGKHSINEVSHATGISRTCLYYYVNTKHHARSSQNPGYDNVVKLAWYLRDAFNQIPMEQIRYYRNQFPHIGKLSCPETGIPKKPLSDRPVDDSFFFQEVDD